MSLTEWLDFGSMNMVPGRAFLLGTNSASVAATPSSPPVPVCKQWLNVDGRTVLVESVPLAAITNSLPQLPAFTATSLKPSAGPVPYVVSNQRLLPAPRTGAKTKTEIDRSDIAPGDFDMEFNYCRVQREAGDASGGEHGYWVGPDGAPARAGFASANGSFFEFAGSGQPLAFLDSNQTTGLIYNDFNSSDQGRYVFQFRNGTPLQTP